MVSLVVIPADLAGVVPLLAVWSGVVPLATGCARLAGVVSLAAICVGVEVPVVAGVLLATISVVKPSGADVPLVAGCARLDAPRNASKLATAKTNMRRFPI